MVRLERLVDQQLIDAGAAIVLTNSDAIWRPSTTGRSTGYDAFRIHAGATLSGALDWGPSAGVGTRKGREASHALNGTYTASWRPFSRVATSRAASSAPSLVVPPT